MMSQLSMPSIFLGVTPAPVRRYLTTIFKPAAGRYSRIVLPCAGRFSGTMVALAAGFAPASVYCSDISLFTGMIGHLAAGTDPRALGAAVNMPDLPELQELANGSTDAFEHAAATLLALKIATTKGKGAYAKMFTSDLRGEWRRHYEIVKTRLTKLVTDLKGINYDPADLFDAVNAAAPDDKAIVYLAPPDVSGGYGKMFDAGDMVTFQKPPIANFDPKTGFEQLEEITSKARALVLTLRPYDDRKPDKHPGAIFAALGGTRLHVLLCNRKEEATGMAKVRAAAPPDKVVTPRYPVWGSRADAIRPDSKIQITKAKGEVALYYRDLFAHRLGLSVSEAYFLMWVDGKVFGTVGMHLAFAITGRPYDADDGRLFVFQTFAMSASHDGYKHLTKLLNMCVTCEEFLALVKRGARFPMGDPVGVRTACITRGAEQKGNRGVMKLLKREQRPDGMYHLTYQTEWRPGTYQDQLAQWLARDAKQKERTDGDPVPADPASA